MELTKPELFAVEAVFEGVAESNKKELDALQLLLVGGGFGETAL